MSQKGKNNSIFAVSECWECPLSDASNGATWCTHPDGPTPPVEPRVIPDVCPLRKAPAIIMLKKEADKLSEILTRLGERLFGEITK